MREPSGENFGPCTAPGISATRRTPAPSELITNRVGVPCSELARTAIFLESLDQMAAEMLPASAPGNVSDFGVSFPPPLATIRAPREEGPEAIQTSFLPSGDTETLEKCVTAVSYTHLRAHETGR